MRQRQRTSSPDPRSGLLATLLVGVVVACAGPPAGPPFERAPSPPENRARLYVYRLDARPSFSPVRISVGGREIGGLQHGEYQTLELPAGGRLLRAGVRSVAFVAWGWNEQRIRLEPGETAYVKISVRVTETGPALGRELDIAGRPTGSASENVYIQLQPEKLALEELAGTRRILPGS